MRGYEGTTTHVRGDGRANSRLCRGVQSEAATCSEYFVICFSESSSSLLGQYGSYSTAQQPAEPSKNILHNMFDKLPPQTVVEV